MNGHDDNKGKQEAGTHSPLKHMLHMAICCGLPILIIAVLPLITKANPGLGGKLIWIVPLLCPIMMMVMMPMMHKGDKKENCHDDKNKNINDNKPLEINKSAE